MRRRAAIATEMTLLALLVLGTAVSAAAEQGTSDPVPTRLTVTPFSPKDPELPNQVVAILAAADGTPVSNATVSFFLETELLGTRYATIGSAVTDATGTARIAFTPRVEENRIRAKFEGNAEHEAAVTDADIAFPAERVEAVPIPHHIHSQLSPIRRIMPTLISAGVAVLWALLITLTALTIRGVRRHREEGALALQEAEVVNN